MTLRIRKYSWQMAPAAIRGIRQRVFIDEQGVPPELEWDATDALADHYLALTPDNTPVAVARLIPALSDTAHIGRMAVLPGHRGRGLGRQLLRHLVTDAAPHFDDLRLSAQEHALAFYQRCGFHVCSGPYEDAGITHFDMRCLAPAMLQAASDAQPWPLHLGADTQSWLFHRERQCTALLDSLVAQARQRLWLYDRTLGHDLYDRGRLRELVSELARHHRHSEVRLLIHDDKPLVKRRHALVQLMARLPSHVSLRLVNPARPCEDRPFVLVDRDGVLVRHGFDDASGFAGFADSARVRLLEETFRQMWEPGRASAELRRLPL